MFRHMFHVSYRNNSEPLKLEVWKTSCGNISNLARVSPKVQLRHVVEKTNNSHIGTFEEYQVYENFI